MCLDIMMGFHSVFLYMPDYYKKYFSVPYLSISFSAPPFIQRNDGNNNDDGSNHNTNDNILCDGFCGF